MSKLIITYVLLTVIPMSFLGFIAYNQYSKSIEEQVGEYIPKILEQANENIDNQLRELKKLPDLLYNSSQVIGVLRKDSYQNRSALLQDEFLINSYLSRTYINGGNPDILGVFLLSKNRMFKSTKVPYSGIVLDNIIFPYNQDIDMEGREEILLPFQTSLQFADNRPFILFIRQLRDLDNRKNLGTVIIAVEISFFKNILKNMEDDNRVDISIINEQGRIIYHSNDEWIGEVHEEYFDYPIKNGSFRKRSREDNELISVSTSNYSNWILVHSIPLKYLTEHTDLVKNATIAVFIIFVVISTAISIVLAWNVSSPLHHLTKLMKRVEKGDFNVDLSIQSKDEVGMLANSFNSMIYEIRDLIKKNYKSELSKKEAELFALQSQINPHFMYNTLETIGMAMEEGETETVVTMVTILGRMLRYSISNKDSFVPISKEVLHICDYLTIQKIRFEERLDYTINVTIDTESYVTPKFILQPIVENAIKYGLEQQPLTKIEIEISEEKVSNGRAIVMLVRDNGPGMEEDKLKKLQQSLQGEPTMKRDAHFGLMNVHSRIAMAFGEDYGIKVCSEWKKGTEITVIIPVLPSEYENKVDGGNSTHDKGKN